MLSRPRTRSGQLSLLQAPSSAMKRNTTPRLPLRILWLATALLLSVLAVAVGDASAA